MNATSETAAPANPPRPLRLIMDMVAEHFGLAPLDLLSDRHARRVSWPRMVSWALALEYTRLTETQIGRAFDRDRSTISHGYDRIVALSEREGEIGDALDVLRARCRSVLPPLLRQGVHQPGVRTQARNLFERLINEVPPMTDAVQLVIEAGRMAERLADGERIAYAPTVRRQRRQRGARGVSPKSDARRMADESHVASLRAAGDFGGGHG